MIKQVTYFFYAALLLALVSCNRNRDEMPSLKETYSPVDKNPFGTYLAYQATGALFYQNEIRVRKTGFDKSFSNNNDTGSVYISISKNLFLSNSETAALLSFAEAGNSIFLSAEHFDTTLLSRLGVTYTRNEASWQLDLPEMRASSVGLLPPYYSNQQRYGYFYMPLTRSFDSATFNEIDFLGNNDNHSPNFLAVNYGEGRIYLHCEPRVFSNYFLLQQKNYEYLREVFAFLPEVPEHILWDDFYNKRNEASDTSSGSGLAVLFRYPAMKSAFLLSLFLLAVYLLFGSKRRQRIIKPLPANDNHSVAFAETVSRLYLSKKDNRNIADKLISFFYEHIRNQYFLSTQTISSEFISTLSRKANVAEGDTILLFNTIQRIEKLTTVSDDELLLLNHQIENFYKQHA